MTVTGMSERLNSLSVPDAIKITLGKTRQLILEKNRDQMMQGIRSDGSVIAPPYTYFTRLKKVEKGRDPETVTLYDTGDFHRAMFLDVGAEFVEISSTDYKADELEEKYGRAIFGLTKESTVVYLQEEGMPVLAETIRSMLKL
jgi:hypothetical protein